MSFKLPSLKHFLLNRRAGQAFCYTSENRQHRTRNGETKTREMPRKQRQIKFLLPSVLRSPPPFKLCCVQYPALKSILFSLTWSSEKGCQFQLMLLSTSRHPLTDIKQLLLFFFLNGMTYSRCFAFKPALNWFSVSVGM